MTGVLRAVIVPSVMTLTTVPVQAVVSVRTRGGLVVALKGESGAALKGARPSSSSNWGRVLVRWRGQRHAYWCRREDLTARDGLLESCVARKPSRPRPLCLPRVKAGQAAHYGANLALLRRARGVSQVDLSLRMGAQGFPVRQSTVSHWERAGGCPAGAFVEAAAKALGVPAFVFFMPLADCKALLKTQDDLRSMASVLCR